MKEERLADMFSGNFENKDYVEKLSKEAVEKKMRQSEIERLEGSIRENRLHGQNPFDQSKNCGKSVCFLCSQYECKTAQAIGQEYRN